MSTPTCDSDRLDRIIELLEIVAGEVKPDSVKDHTDELLAAWDQSIRNWKEYYHDQAVGIPSTFLPMSAVVEKIRKP